MINGSFFYFEILMTDHSLLEILLESTGAAIDSRVIEPGQLFFALSGNHTDGVKFAAQALERGAILAIIPKDGELLDSQKK